MHKQLSGVLVGHAHDLVAATGCTVLLFPQGAICGVDQRGGAPGTRETDLLRPMHLVEKIHGLVLSGGSAFGLSAADGVVKWLEERKYGFDVGVAHVPIVPAASLFDLTIGRPDVRPDAAMGYQACESAVPDWYGFNGNVGAGAGATVGHLYGSESAMKGGLGTATLEVMPGVIVAAIIAVNCFGNVVDHTTGKVLIGSRTPDGNVADMLESLSKMPKTFDASVKNTVIGVVVTNAPLSKEHANKVAQMAHNGLARTIFPAHTMFDGDTIFAVSTASTADSTPFDANVIGAFATEAVSQAVLKAVREAETLCGVKAFKDM